MEEQLSYVKAAPSCCLPMKLRGRTEKCLGRDGELFVFISESIMFIFLLWRNLPHFTLPSFVFCFCFFFFSLFCSISFWFGFGVPLEHCRANSALPPRQLQYL